LALVRQTPLTCLAAVEVGSAPRSATGMNDNLTSPPSPLQKGRSHLSQSV